MKQCHAAGCSPEEEMMETSEELFTGQCPVPSLKHRVQINFDLRYKEVVLVHLQKDVVADILSPPIKQSEKRKIQQKTWNMVVVLRTATDWQVNFEKTKKDAILRHSNHTSKGFGKFF